MRITLRRVGQLLGAPVGSIRSRLREGEDVRVVEEAHLVDADWYRRRYPDVARAGISPVRHFVRHGFRERRDPNATFTTRDYVHEHPSAAASAASMAAHYLANRVPPARSAGESDPASGPVVQPSSGESPYEHRGHCPICQKSVRFVSTERWYRDHLLCEGCDGSSIPRERGLMHVVRTFYPDWETLAIHESSPVSRGASALFRKHCSRYVASQFFPDVPPGETHEGFRCEDLERLTFPDETFDLTISQDVMEHVNRPDLAFREIARTLKSGGAHVFTAPTYKGLERSFRRAYLRPGSVEHLHEPEHHASPIDPNGALVTFHYGYDLPERIHEWSGLDTTVLRFHDHHIGVIGDFTEVYLSRKR